MSNAPQRVPNLYQLLGLAPLESDRSRIEAALIKVQARIQAATEAATEAAKTGASTLEAPSLSPAELARWQKLLAMGQLLLDPKRKQAYDLQWQAVLGQPQTPAAKLAPASSASARASNPATSNTVASNTVASNTVTSNTVTSNTVASSPALSSPAAARLEWNLDTLEALLPADDPHAAFDMASCMRSGQVRDPAAAQADLNKLIVLLGGQPLPGSTSATGSSSTVLTTAVLPSASDSAPLSVSSFKSHPASAGPSAASGLAKRLQQKRQKALILGSAGLAAGAVGLVGLFLYLNQAGSKPATSPLAQAQPAATPSVEPAVPQVTTQAVSPSPQTPVDSSHQPLTTTGSGLPVPGQSDKPLEIMAEPLSRSPESQLPPAAAPQAPASTAANAMTGDSATSAAANPEPKPTEPKPTEPSQSEPRNSEPLKPEMGPEMAAVEMSPAASSPEKSAVVEVTLTSAEKSAWKKSMTKVRESLGVLNVVGALDELKQLESSAKIQKQREQLERLRAVAALVEVAKQAIVDSITSAEAAQELKIGRSTVVSIIEADPDRLVVKVNGRPQRYALGQIPARMGEALIELKAGLPLGQKQAAKGAYFVLHPKNDLVLTEGRRLLEESAQAGAIPADVARFFEDDYSLNQK